MWNPFTKVPFDRSPSSRKEELRSFVFLSIVIAPILAVMIVASYGFVVWVYQIFAGPPG